DVAQIKKKYWARGKESEMGVDQNRLFSKAGKLHFGTFLGVTFVDPFLSVYPLGFSAGYLFNEFFAFSLVGFKDFSLDSSALKQFYKEKNGKINLNRPKYYIGGEGSLSLIYGKLSLLGKSI